MPNDAQTDTDSRSSKQEQLIAFTILMKILQDDGYCGLEQREIANRLGIPTPDASKSIARIKEALRRHYLLDNNHRGEASLVRPLLELSKFKFGNTSSKSLAPKGGWVYLIQEITEDIWKTEWVQNLFDLSLFEGWLLGSSKSETASLSLILPIIESLFKSVRVSNHTSDIRWSEIPDTFCNALPRSIKEAIEGRGAESQSVINRRIYEDYIHPDWTFENDNSDLWDDQRFLIFRSVLTRLHKKQEVTLIFRDYIMRVDQIRYAKGVWVIDGCSSGGIHSICMSRLPQCQLGTSSRIHRPFNPSNIQKLNANIYLTSGADRRFILDYDPIVELEVKRLFYATAHDCLDNAPNDIPRGWKTLYISVSFANMHSNDMAWVEFVQNLLGLINKVRLRGITNEDSHKIEESKYLWFCTGSLPFQQF